MRVVSWVESGVWGDTVVPGFVVFMGSSARQESADSYLFNSK
jgi:hypothetical protein